MRGAAVAFKGAPWLFACHRAPVADRSEVTQVTRGQSFSAGTAEVRAIVTTTNGGDAGRDQALALFRGNRLLRGLEDELLRRISGFAVTKRYGDGALLFAKGDAAEGLFAVVSGQVRISVYSGAGKEVLLNLLGPGDSFGEIALLDGWPRTANAVAQGPLTVLLLRRSEFLRVVDREPRLARHVIELLCDRLRWVSGTVEDTAFLDLEGRLAKRLLHMAGVYGQPVADGRRLSIRISQQDLAMMVNASREKVNRKLRLLRRQDAIRMDRGHIVITDQDALERLAADADLP